MRDQNLQRRRYIYFTIFIDEFLSHRYQTCCIYIRHYLVNLPLMIRLVVSFFHSTWFNSLTHALQEYCPVSSQLQASIEMPEHVALWVPLRYRINMPLYECIQGANPLSDRCLFISQKIETGSDTLHPTWSTNWSSILSTKNSEKYTILSFSKITSLENVFFVLFVNPLYILVYL